MTRTRARAPTDEMSQNNYGFNVLRIRRVPDINAQITRETVEKFA